MRHQWIFKLLPGSESQPDWPELLKSLQEQEFGIADHIVADLIPDLIRDGDQSLLRIEALTVETD